MAAGTCAICDADTAPRDRYCSACGSDLAAVVVEIAGSDQPERHDDAHAGERQRLRNLVGLACVIVVGAGMWLVVSGGGEPDRESVVPAPTVPAVEPATGSPANPPVDRSSDDRPTSTPQPDAGATAAAASIDPTLLPELEASHLAVTGDQSLHVLDLATGVWTLRRLQNTPSSIHGAGGGVVLAGFIGGRLAFAPADGGEPIALGTAENELLRVDENGIVVRRWNASPPDLVGIALDGRRRWRFSPPPGTSTIGVTSEGEVVVQAAQIIIAVDPVTQTTRPITDGLGFGVSADVVIVWQCDADLSCRTDQLHVVTGERRLLAVEGLQLQPAGDQVFRAFVREGTDQARAYRLVDGWLERVNEPRPERRGRTAIDATGVAVTVEDSTLVLRSGDGSVVATIASPVQRGGAQVALVPAPPTP